MLRASHILIAHEDATRSQRNVSREEALFLIADIQKKMYLDGAKESREPLHAFPGMIQTIKVPNNMKQLNKALPKPCYSDVRPNTPGAWVVADQSEHEKNLAKARKAAETAAAIS